MVTVWPTNCGGNLRESLRVGPMLRRTLALLLATLILPAAAFGQSAGDQQYQDPFGGRDKDQSSSQSAPPAYTAPAPTAAPVYTPTYVAPVATPTPKPKPKKKKYKKQVTPSLTPIPGV